MISCDGSSKWTFQFQASSWRRRRDGSSMVGSGTIRVEFDASKKKGSKDVLSSLLSTVERRKWTVQLLVSQLASRTMCWIPARYCRLVRLSQCVKISISFSLKTISSFLDCHRVCRGERSIVHRLLWQRDTFYWNRLRRKSLKKTNKDCIHTSLVDTIVT